MNMMYLIEYKMGQNSSLSCRKLFRPEVVSRALLVNFSSVYQQRLLLARSKHSRFWLSFCIYQILFLEHVCVSPRAAV